MNDETKKHPAFLRFQEQSMLRFKEDEPPPETKKFWACAAVGIFIGFVVSCFGTLGSALVTAGLTTFLLWTLVKRGKQND